MLWKSICSLFFLSHTFQIIRHNLILDNDNSSKGKMQFLNVTLLMGKKVTSRVQFHQPRRVLLMSHLNLKKDLKSDDLTEQRAMPRSKETAEEHNNWRLSVWQDLQSPQSEPWSTCGENLETIKSKQLTKITLRVHQWIIKQVTTDPEIHRLQATLVSVRVHESTIIKQKQHQWESSRKNSAEQGERMVTL